VYREDALPYGAPGRGLPRGFGPGGWHGPAAGDWLSGRAPRSHRGGHWFDPSIAHQVRGYVDLRRDHHGSHSCGQRASTLPAMAGRRRWAKTASTSIKACALRWDHVDLEGDPTVPPHVDVWRSVRAHGDTKTKKSRRSLGMPSDGQDFRQRAVISRAAPGARKRCPPAHVDFRVLVSVKLSSAAAGFHVIRIGHVRNQFSTLFARNSSFQQ